MGDHANYFRFNNNKTTLCRSLACLCLAQTRKAETPTTCDRRRNIFTIYLICEMSYYYFFSCGIRSCKVNNNIFEKVLSINRNNMVISWVLLVLIIIIKPRNIAVWGTCTYLPAELFRAPECWGYPTFYSDIFKFICNFLTASCRRRTANALSCYPPPARDT